MGQLAHITHAQRHRSFASIAFDGPFEEVSFKCAWTNLEDTKVGKKSKSIKERKRTSKLHTEIICQV